MASFVCSVGNVPLAAVLWNGGISFGGVVSLIFDDLLIIPILLIYRKYYGARTAWILTGCLYAAAVIAGYVVELLFTLVGLVPTGARLVWRFLATGGRQMLARMGGAPEGASGGDGDAGRRPQRSPERS